MTCSPRHPLVDALIKQQGTTVLETHAATGQASIQLGRLVVLQSHWPL